MPPPPPMNPLLMGMELVFTILSVIFCFVVYYKTKELYELTKHQGIKFFRDAFLYFGFSYVLRFIFGLVFLSRITLNIHIPREVFPFLFILPLGYFSTMGIFYLMFSTFWKRFSHPHALIFGHSLALILSIISFFMRSPLMLVYLQCIFLSAIIVINLFSKTKGKKISQMKLLYLLVSLLWLLNLLTAGRKPAVSFGFSFIAQVSSILVFFTIYYKLSKWIK